MQIDVHHIIGSSEFRARIAEIIDEVAVGSTYVITRGGRPIAVIGPVPAHGETISPLSTAPTQHEPIELE